MHDFHLPRSAPHEDLPDLLTDVKSPVHNKIHLLNAAKSGGSFGNGQRVVSVSLDQHVGGASKYPSFPGAQARNSILPSPGMRIASFMHGISSSFSDSVLVFRSEWFAVQCLLRPASRLKFMRVNGGLHLMVLATCRLAAPSWRRGEGGVGVRFMRNLYVIRLEKETI